jgi:50S ribosomal protein L16 3-hydroxylase
LLQAQGRKRWRIGGPSVGTERLVPDLELSILAGFVPEREWILDAGDMLYLPPRAPHEGVAIGPGLTYSMGFRAPSHQEVLAGFLSHAVETIDPELRYTDPRRRPSRRPGEIDRETIAAFRAVITEALADREELADWIGRFLTEPKRPREGPGHRGRRTTRQLDRALAQGSGLRRVTVPRFAFRPGPRAHVRLFVGGKSYDLEPELGPAAELLCGTAVLSRATLAPYLRRRRFRELLQDLWQRGYLEPS